MLTRTSLPKAPILLAGLLAVLLLSAGCMMGDHRGMMNRGGSDPDDEAPATGVTEVSIEDFAFAPANIVIDAGTTVTWTNYDNVGHTVTSDSGDELDSGLFGEDDTFSHTFETPGEYRYYCEPHPNMKGLVTVLATETG